jgi:hypothetical protein
MTPQFFEQTYIPTYWRCEEYDGLLFMEASEQIDSPSGQRSYYNFNIMTHIDKQPVPETFTGYVSHHYSNGEQSLYAILGGGEMDAPRILKRFKAQSAAQVYNIREIQKNLDGLLSALESWNTRDPVATHHHACIEYMIQTVQQVRANNVQLRLEPGPKTIF